MDVLIVIFGVAGLVWALVILRRGGLLAACLAELLVAACLGYQFYRFTVGSTPVTIDRLLLVVLCGLYLLYRWKGWADPKPPDRADYAVLLLLAVLTVNTLAHDWRYGDNQPLSDLVLYFWQPAAVYWIARQSVLNRAGLRLFRSVLAIFGLYLALTAVAEWQHVSALIFPSYIATANVAAWEGRVHGPFLSPPTNGFYLGVSLCVWMMYWPGASRPARAAIVAAMGVVLLGLYLTLTRACWMGALLGVWVVLLLALPRPRRAAFVVGSLLLAAAALPIAGSTLIGFQRGPQESAHVTELSARLRPVIAALEWDVFTDHPLFGCGYGNYEKVSVDYLRNTNSSQPLDAAKGYAHHNMFLAILTETGITGFACYLGMFGLWSVNAWRLWSRRCLPLEVRQQGLIWLAYLANLLVLGMFHNANVDLNLALLTFLMAGVTQGTAAAARRPENVRGRCED
jgi:O-antigen ligase